MEAMALLLHNKDHLQSRVAHLIRSLHHKAMGIIDPLHHPRTVDLARIMAETSPHRTAGMGVDRATEGIGHHQTVAMGMDRAMEGTGHLHPRVVIRCRVEE
jgi:hypothetical protein